MRGSTLATILMSQLVAGGWLLLRYYYGVPFEVMLAGLVGGIVAFVVGWPLGWVVGRYISRDSDVDATSFKIIAGANLIAWILPPAGVALSTITFHFFRRSDTMRAFYWVLAAIGGWAAMVTAGIGGAHEMEIRETRAKALEMTGVVDSGERSAARCPYAAREAWSTEDVQKYCH